MFNLNEKDYSNIERIAVISDSALGFGSPDIQGLADGLCKRFKAKGLLIQPDDINRPLIKLDFEADIRSTRVYSLLPTYTRSWRWDFFRQAGRLIDQFKPQLVVAVGPNGYGATRAMRHKPRILCYYMLEMVTHEPLFANLHEVGGNANIDCYIIPDAERFNIDFKYLNWKKDVPVDRIFLTAPIDYPRPMRSRSAEERNGKFIYFGSIHPTETLLDSMISPDFDDVPIDFYGRISGSNRADVVNRISATPNKYYGGLAPPQELVDLLPQYNYSLVTWLPEGSVARYYLPATKLYHSIMAGVPVIAVSNPFNAYFIERYKCGLLLESWHKSSLQKTFQAAGEMRETDAYRTMVDNCKKLAEGAFNWESQVDRAENLVRTTLSKKWQRRYGKNKAATND